MGAQVPKQYMDLGGQPLFTHAYARLEACSLITDMVLTVPAGDEDYARGMLTALGLGSKLRAVTFGGAERSDSVAASLEAVTWPCDVVFIHDGARPFPEEGFVRALYEAVQEGADGAVAAVPAKDTIKVVDEDGWAVSTPDRSHLWQMQTPQVFPYTLIRDVYRELQAAHIPVTDDAMAAEVIRGARIRMVMASYRNFKVTTREDLVTAEAFLREEREQKQATED